MNVLPESSVLNIFHYNLLDKHAVGAVGVEDAVQVVGLVLEDNGGEAPDSIGYRPESQCVRICDDYLRIPLYHSVISRN